MTPLFYYIEKTLTPENRHDSAVNEIAKVENKTLHDEQAELMLEMTRWQFTDGTILQCTREKELTQATVNECSCPESWITWEAVNAPAEEIRPKKKTFYNRCQEAHWLKMQKSAMGGC